MVCRGVVQGPVQQPRQVSRKSQNKEQIFSNDVQEVNYMYFLNFYDQKYFPENIHVSLANTGIRLFFNFTLFKISFLNEHLVD